MGETLSFKDNETEYLTEYKIHFMNLYLYFPEIFISQLFLKEFLHGCYFLNIF